MTKKIILIAFYSFVGLLTAISSTSSAETTPAETPNLHYTAPDVLAFTRVGTVIASPDSKKVAFITMNVTNKNLGKAWRYNLSIKDASGKIINLVESPNPINLPTWN